MDVFGSRKFELLALTESKTWGNREILWYRKSVVYLGVQLSKGTFFWGGGRFVSFALVGLSKLSCLLL